VAKDNSNHSIQTLKCRTVLDLIILITTKCLNKTTNFSNQEAFNLHILPKIKCILDLIVATILDNKILNLTLEIICQVIKTNIKVEAIPIVSSSHNNKILKVGCMAT